MRRIRFVEEAIAQRYSEGKMRCPTHLSVGQEAVAAAVGMALRKDDVAVSGHRAHAHYLGKGGNLNALIAEIYGKVTGCARGKGGSMHLIDESVGFKGSTAIVGGTVPIGVGLAYAISLRGADQISCIYLGDAVVESGGFFESANFAALKQLPVLFICENNLYSVYSPLSVRQPAGRKIHEMVAGLGLNVMHGDGNDARFVFNMANEAISGIRAGNGPVFIEFSTYRWREHCGPFYDNDIGYRTQQEFEEWRRREPIQRLEVDLLKNGVLTQSDLENMDKSIRRETDAAFEFAEASPFPAPEEAYTGLYAHPIGQDVDGGFKG